MIDKRILALGLVLASIATASYLYGARQRTQQQRHTASQSKLEMVKEAKEIAAKLNGADSADAAAQALPNGPQLTKLRDGILNIPNPTHKAAYNHLETAVKTALPKIEAAIAGVTNKPALKTKAQSLHATGIAGIKKAAKALVTAINTALGDIPGDGEEEEEIDPDAAAKAALRAQIKTAWAAAGGVLEKYEALTNKVTADLPATKKTTAKYNSLVSQEIGSTYANLDKNSDAELAGLNAVQLNTRLTAINDYLAELNAALGDANDGFVLMNGYFKDKAPVGGGGDPDAAEKATRRAEIKALWVGVNQINQIIEDLEEKNADVPANKILTEKNTNLLAKKATLLKTDDQLNAMTLDELNANHTAIVAYKAKLQQALADANGGFATGNEYFADKPAVGGGDAITEAFINTLKAMEVNAENKAGGSIVIKVFKNDNLDDFFLGKDPTTIDDAELGNVFTSITLAMKNKMKSKQNVKDQFKNAIEASGGNAGLIAKLIAKFNTKMN